MGVRYKLARAQLAALAPCQEGLALFDELAPRGVIATKKPERAEEMARRSPEYAQWIGNVLPTQEGARFGDGDGYGYGDGDGYGYGYGSGSGDGDGYGYGYGSGSGYGYGYGYGSGDGYGDGYGYGYGSGSGYGYGSGDVTRAGARVLQGGA